jgi:small conductance mechanosensitive channel
LIKDYVGGIVILMEDQFRVGDAVTILDYIGTVEEISLRSTRLRDVEGRLVILSNGDIREVTRAGYDWARAVVDLNVAYNADISTLVQVLDGALVKAQEDAEISSYLLEKPEIQGWSGFTPWSVQVRLTAKTVPDKKLEVATRLRRYAQEALRDAGLPMATPPVETMPPAA